MLSVIYAKCHKHALYAECRYAEYRYGECRGAAECDDWYFLVWAELE